MTIKENNQFAFRKGALNFQCTNSPPSQTCGREIIDKMSKSATRLKNYKLKGAKLYRNFEETKRNTILHLSTFVRC